MRKLSRRSPLRVVDVVRIFLCLYTYPVLIFLLTCARARIILYVRVDDVVISYREVVMAKDAKVDERVGEVKLVEAIRESDALRQLDAAVDEAVYQVSKLEVALRQARVAERRARAARAHREY